MRTFVSPSRGIPFLPAVLCYAHASCATPRPWLCSALLCAALLCSRLSCSCCCRAIEVEEVLAEKVRQLGQRILQSHGGEED